MTVFSQLKTATRIARLVATSKQTLSLAYLITMRCNARCKMCLWWREVYGESRQHDNELSLEQIDAFSRSVGPQVRIEVTGGEPFLRKDIEDALLILGHNCRPVVYTISTNGSLTERIVKATRALCKAVPDTHVRVNISLDGVEDTHDEIRNFPGLYQRARGTFRELRALRGEYPNLTANVTTVLSGYNHHNISEILDGLRRDMRPDRLGIMLARGHTPEEKAKSVSLDEYARVLEENRRGAMSPEERPHYLSRLGQALDSELTKVILHNARHQCQAIPCLGGIKHVMVMADGTLLPCDVLGPFLEEHPCKALPDPIMARLEDYDYSIPKALESTRARKVQGFIRGGGCWCTSDCGVLPSLMLNPKLYPTLAWAGMRCALRSLRTTSR